MTVAIVGAGICGLYLARKLSEQGQEVTVFEKRQKIGKEACSGLLSERILDFFPESQKLIKSEIKGVLVHFPKKTVKINFSKKFLIIDHALLDNLAAEAAKSAGAKILLGENISGLPEGFDKIIGCDGALSPIRRQLGIKDPKFRLGVQGFENLPAGRQGKNDSSSFVEVWPVQEGFLWKIPREENIEYGIIGKPDSAPQIFKEFLKEKSIKIENIRAAVIPMEWRHFLVPKNSRIALCGDAAAMVKPWSGGGVLWGLLAADILLKNFPDFLKYHQAAKMAIYPKILLGTAAKKLVYFFGFNAPWILPKSVKIDGDFLLKQ